MKLDGNFILDNDHRPFAMFKSQKDAKAFLDALALARRVARLNKDRAEIGAGLLAQLVGAAKDIVEQVDREKQ